MGLISVLVTALALSGIASDGPPRHRQLMADPLFGITYDPQKVRFDEAPALIGQLCSDLHDRKMWIYGHWKTPDTEYFILSGLGPIYPDIAGASNPRPTGVEPDIVGTAVAISGSKCVDDQSDYFLSQTINRARGATPIRAPESVLEAIAADAIKRYTRAFGGKQQFLKKLTPEDREAVAPVVRKQLELFEHSVPDDSPASK